MGKKIKHFFDPAEEFLKSQQEALRTATANSLGELLKPQQEALRTATANPLGELLKSQQEALRTATANSLGELSEKIFKDLLKPINYLEEQVKAMNIAVLGKDYFNVTALSAIHAIEEQRDSFIKHSTPEWYLETPLYNLSRLEGLNPEEFETEEEWFDEIEKIWNRFLEQLFENIKEYNLSIVRYLAIHHLEFFAMILALYLFNQSASKQDIEATNQNIDNLQQDIQLLHKEITPPDKINQERNKLLENKLNKLIEALEKFQQELGEFGKNIPSEEKITLYKTIISVAVKAEPSTDSTTITQLAANEPVKWIAQELDWIQVQFFDYIYWELKTGWIQKQNLELLIPLPVGNSNQLTVEQEETAGEQILQAHRQIMEKYQTAFQRLANS